jgi:protein CMS1
VDTVAVYNAHTQGDEADIKDVYWYNQVASLDYLVRHICPDHETTLLRRSIIKEPKGSPLMVILAASGQKCADLIRSLPEFHARVRLAKLFAKHFKPKEQASYLATNVVRIAVGTPNRIAKLVADGALKLDRLEHIVLDMSRDIKTRHLLSMPDTRKDMIELALLDKVQPRIASGQIKLTMY